jgi:hypothetical protein
MDIARHKVSSLFASLPPAAVRNALIHSLNRCAAARWCAGVCARDECDARRLMRMRGIEDPDAINGVMEMTLRTGERRCNAVERRAPRPAL